MNTFTLVTGGSRSGKSAFAQQLAEQFASLRFFIATCPCIDLEMNERIAAHKKAREGRGWQTEEEPLLLVERLRRAPAGSTVLIDCLPLWINNLMHEAEASGHEKINEEKISVLAHELGKAARRHSHHGRVIVVTGETGMGIIPDTPAARRFRDLIGRCNQVIASAADEVFLVCCGISVKIK